MEDRGPTEPLGKESTRSQASSELAFENPPQYDAPFGQSEEKSVEVSDSSGPQAPEQPHLTEAGSPPFEPVIDYLAGSSGNQTDKRELPNHSSRNTSDNDAYQKFRSR